MRFILALTGVLLFARPLVAGSPALFAGLLVGRVVVYAAGLVALNFWSNRRQWQIRTEENAFFRTARASMKFGRWAWLLACCRSGS